MFLFCLFIMQPWFYPVVKYCFNAICFTRFIFVNSVIVSSIISCNDLYQDFSIMYIWYFVSRNSISVLGAIWPSLSPCTVINPILLTYLLSGNIHYWVWFHQHLRSDVKFKHMVDWDNLVSCMCVLFSLTCCQTPSDNLDILRATWTLLSGTK